MKISADRRCVAHTRSWAKLKPKSAKYANGNPLRLEICDRESLFVQH